MNAKKNGATPGPWTTEDRATTNADYWEMQVMDPGGFAVALAYGDKAEDAESNARLIAASPDMLAAIQAIITYLDGDRSRDHKAILAQMVAAEIKAMGDSP